MSNLILAMRVLSVRGLNEASGHGSLTFGGGERASRILIVEPASAEGRQTSLEDKARVKPILSGNTVKSTKCQVIDLGLVEYQEAYRIQKEILEERKRGKISDTLLLLEHPSVITAGRTSKSENILVSEEELKALDIMVCRTDRGGDVTFHGPGQLVTYFIFDLKEQVKDIHLYLRKLEEVVIQFLKEYRLKGLRKYGFTGVWVDGQKIASIGIGVSAWVTYHGLAININTDLDKFLLIKPCGMDSHRMTSLSQLLRKTISIPEAKRKLLKAFKIVFNLGD